MAIKQIRLIPHLKIYLHVFDGDGRLFVKRFRETWTRLPLGVRRKISSYWRSNKYGFQPFIELSNFFGRDDIYGQVKNDGYTVKFRASEFDEMPDKTAHWIIAHELAHVYNRAIGNSPFFSEEGGFSIDEERNEEAVNKLVESWGFSKAWRILWDARDSD